MIVVQRGRKSHPCTFTQDIFYQIFLILSVLSLQEAAELSSLKSQLQELEVPLFAVVKENLGKELDCFKRFFSGKVYVDQQVCSQLFHLKIGDADREREMIS